MSLKEHSRVETGVVGSRKIL